MRRLVAIVCTLLQLGSLAADGPARPVEDLLADAERLYSEAKYAECLALVEEALRVAEAREAAATPSQRARSYSLKALAAYALREEGTDYQEAVRRLLLQAIEADPYHELGDPATVPPFVARSFQVIRTEYLARFARTTRRYSVGVLGALVVDPTQLNRPSLLQPGLFFGYNVSESWTLALEMRLPLSLPLTESLRGQATAVWYPSFHIGRLATGVAASYLFALDSLATYSHCLSLGGQAELVTRSGFGVAARAELVRVDLIFGSLSSEDLPDYRSLSLFEGSFLRTTFANTTVYLFYVFGGRRSP